VTEYGLQETNRSGYQPLDDVVRHKTTIDFEASFLNQTILDDFRTRYQNYDLLTNFTEYNTPDKFGKLCKASVKWNPISMDWNPDYESDSQGNVGATCTFQCELRYYVVYDKYYNYIETIDIEEYAEKANNDEEPVLVNKITNDEPTPTEEPTLLPTESIDDQIDEWIRIREQS
jgi:hypothetical protein